MTQTIEPSTLPSNALILKTILSNATSEATRKTHESRLSSLMKITHDHTKFSLMRIISNPDKYSKRLKKQYPSPTTQKNLVTTVLSVFKYMDLQCKLQEAHEKWLNVHKELHEQQTLKVKENKPSPNQEQAYVSFEEIKKKYKELKHGDDPHATLRDSLILTFLAFTVYQKPKRADLGCVRIYNTENGKATENYIRLLDDSSFIVLNKYKTAKTNGPIIEELQPKFVRALRRSLKVHPRQYLFVQGNGEPFTKNNSYTQFIIRNMERLFDGKRVGVSLLRHIYITEKVDLNKLSVNDQENIAKQMGHSTNLQNLYKWRI